MENLKLDEYCWQILIVFILVKQEMHFNELCGKLKTHGFKMTVPTVSNHLKHLVKNSYLTRTKKEDSQLVTYSFDYDKFNKIVDVGKWTKNLIKSRRKTEKEFLSLPEEEQIKETMYMSAIRKLYEIKATIEYDLKPSLANRIQIMFWASPIVQSNEISILNKCEKDEEYRKRILKAIDNIIEKNEEI